MSKATRLTPAQWTTIREQIKQQHGLGTVLVRSHMKDVMGFTPREHVSYINNKSHGEIHLDWYNESKRTMFLLQYSDVLNSK